MRGLVNLFGVYLLIKILSLPNISWKMGRVNTTRFSPLEELRIILPSPVISLWLEFSLFHRSLEHRIMILRCLHLTTHCHFCKKVSPFWNKASLSSKICVLIIKHILYCTIINPLKAKSESETFLRPTVSRPVCLGIKHPSGAYDQIFITVNHLRVCWYGALSMTIGRVCPLHLLLVLASAVILGSESRGTHKYILLSQIRNFPFRRLPWLSGLLWRYSTAPSFAQLSYL
jgi:hypothetical protein